MRVCAGPAATLGPVVAAGLQCEAEPALPAPWLEAAATTDIHAGVRKKGSGPPHSDVLL